MPGLIEEKTKKELKHVFEKIPHEQMVIAADERAKAALSAYDLLSSTSLLQAS